MNTTVDVKTRSWLNTAAADKTAAEVELGCLLSNVDSAYLIAPLRESWTKPSQTRKNGHRAEEKRQAAMDLQAQWMQWLEQREILTAEIKRGKECLEKAKQDLESTRQLLEDWATFERHCGKNPLVEYAQTLSANERIRAFLPGWLKRRERELNLLNRKVERCARENDLLHLV